MFYFLLNLSTLQNYKFYFPRIVLLYLNDESYNDLININYKLDALSAVLKNTYFEHILPETENMEKEHESFIDEHIDKFKEFMHKFKK